MALSLPTFLGPLTDLPREPLFQSAWKSLVGEQVDEDDVGFSMLAQEANNWCWAAVAQAARFHFIRVLDKSQTQIATDHIRRSRPHVTCRANQGDVAGGTCNGSLACTRPCNGMHTVRVILGEVGLEVGILSAEAPVSFEAIRSEVRAGAPVICRIDFGSFGHFICVSGWRVKGGQREVRVHDPKQDRRGQVFPLWIPFAGLDRYVRSGLVGRNNYAYWVRG